MSTETRHWTHKYVETCVEMTEERAQCPWAWRDQEINAVLDVGVQELLLNRDVTPHLQANGGELAARLLSALQTLNDERLVRRSQEG